MYPVCCKTAVSRACGVFLQHHAGQDHGGNQQSHRQQAVMQQETRNLRPIPDSVKARNIRKPDARLVSDFGTDSARVTVDGPRRPRPAQNSIQQRISGATWCISTMPNAIIPATENNWTIAPAFINL